MNLDLVPTDALWSALSKRHDAAILVAVRSIDERREERLFWWSGGLTRSIGLAEYARHRAVSEAGNPPGEADL